MYLNRVYTRHGQRNSIRFFRDVLPAKMKANNEYQTEYRLRFNDV